MQFATVVLAIVLGLSCREVGAVQDAGSPLPKVIKLLSNLKDALIKDGDRETSQFKEYTEWCRKSARNLKYEIGTEKDDIADHEATISKADSDISTASSKIEDEASSMSETEGALKAAQGVRKKEHQEFKASESELMDSIDTLERAGNVLQRKMRGASLVETTVNRKDIRDLISTLNTVVNAASLSLHDKKKLTALVQGTADEDDEDDMGELGAPAAKAYESHGSSILDLLEDLKEKAETQLTELRKEEQNAQHNFEMLQQSLTDQNKVAAEEMAEGKEAKNVASELKATSQSEKDVATTELKTDMESLSNMNTECRTVAAEYDASVRSRAEEMDAINSALQALGGVKPNTGYSLSQVQTTQDNFEVVNMLRKLGQDQHSAALTQLAGRVSTVMTFASRRGNLDPFKKVKEMITQQMAKLNKEAGEESSHKAYCDKETADTKKKKEELKFSLDKGTAQIDKAKAKAAAINENIAKLQEELATLSEEQGEADKLRAGQNANYKTTKADLTEGVAGVRMALKVLRGYYEQKPAELLQRPTPGHSASQGTGDSVISILEMVESDMDKQLSSINIEESEAANAYKKLKEDNSRVRLVKEQTVKYNKKDATALAKTLSEYNSDLDGQQSEMDAVLEYEKNIKGMCAQPVESYEARTARREAEIAGLKEALQAIGAESLLQVAPRHSALRGLAVGRH